MADDRSAWGAVYATSLGVAGLTAAEMLPVSLLTPMATGLSVTEGIAGQAITATAVAAFLSSLLIAVVTRRLDRRTILLSLTAMQVVSNLMVALAPGLPVLLVGRMMLGVSLGGFWALSASVAMRLVPETHVPKAFSIIFGGVSVATVAAAPVGSYLGSLIGWRGVFLVAAALSAIGLVWQSLSLPSMPPRGQTRLATLFHVLRRPRVGVGMSGMGLVFAGHFAFFTYLRPFLETVTQAGGSGVSIILLAFGIGSFLGTTASGWLIGRSLRLTLALAPMLMCAAAVSAVILGRSVTAVTVLVTLWGLSFGTIPVGWSTWLTRTVPDEAESGGGLLVAAIQVAMTFGAAVGGIVVDRDGVSAVFGLSAAVLLAAAVIVVAALRTPASPPATT